MANNKFGHLILSNVSKSYGQGFDLQNINLEIASGEFITFLGPSGSGKTTTLNIIAGFIQPDGGEITLDGRVLNDTPPEDRGVGMVFQNYALFPHMTAHQNVSFPLRMRRVPKAECLKRTDDALELVGLRGLGKRKPKQLSGGQQQRVALARALVFHPSVLLMDEPLGALDKKLRESMQIEIMRMSRELNVTVVYVTHDQEEALSMSGRIAVYRDGRIEQVGVPSEVYKNPSSLFVADFVGESTILKGILHFAEHGCSVDTPLGILPVDPVVCSTKGMVEGASVGLVLRPESMHVTAEGTSIGPMPDNAETVSVEGTLEEVIYLGASTKVVVAFQSNNRAVVRTAAENWKTVRIGEKVRVQWKIKDCVVLPDEDV